MHYQYTENWVVQLTMTKIRIKLRKTVENLLTSIRELQSVFEIPRVCDFHHVLAMLALSADQQANWFES